MAENVPVRCPTCHREHSYTPPTFPCACGAPLTLPVPPDATPELLVRRTWRDSWVAVRCPACDRQGQWPRPELGCACGTVVRLPVAPDAGCPRAAEEEPPDGGGREPGTGARPVFRPVTIRTERDAVMAAERYLRWLGFRGVRRSGGCPAPAASGVDLRGGGLVVRVDPTTLPTTLRDVECLWLHGLLAEAAGVCFSLAGYARDARRRADDLRLPLFLMDLTGTPQALNDWADELVRRSSR
ncbi:hypothetical protein GCM10010218_03250 [Streptomyces mashuensis]|uniref:Restriction endonuclease type IV Mrr domain-containing protein n=1 Tax=Streptomyces mashuensis TaxID=33904 RepID=A0A919E8X4_9ACTN|nr:hypothetical protein [Streptomyces mashuensis]GHF25891.1 hypothetical protein GCM10010218_03250 [Streptomyces mashuensis]